MNFETEEAFDLALRAAVAAGASRDVANSLARAVVSAEWAGGTSVGFAHFIDYLDAFKEGRIRGDAEPEITFPTPSSIEIDAKEGIVQLGFDRAFDQLVSRATENGVAVFKQRNSYTAGELGYYPRRLAQEGLAALAVTNAPALMATPECSKPVFGTNPLSFAAPTGTGKPFVIDQASSATAFVNIRRAAAKGEAIPDGWAVDASGQPTTDSREAIKGALLAFGGGRGANIALMVEILAAGLAGGNWSLDAPSFSAGNRSPSVGLLVVCFKVAANFSERLGAQLNRLADLGVRIPGSHINVRELNVDDSVVEKIQSYLDQ